MIRFFRELLTKPSAYEANPLGHARNQAGHALLGFAAIWLGVPLAVWAAVFIAWETVQYRFFGAAPSDYFEDMSFEAGGALLALHGWPVAAVLTLTLAAGTARRVEEKRRLHASTPTFSDSKS